MANKYRGYYKAVDSNGNLITYEVGDVVSKDDINYLATDTITGYSPEHGTRVGWVSLGGSGGNCDCPAGPTGPTGPQGPIGNTGSAGPAGGGATLAAGAGMALSGIVAGVGHTLGIDPTATIHVAGVSSAGGITLGGNLQTTDNNFDILNADGNKVFDLTTTNLKIGDCDGAGNGNTILIRDSANTITATSPDIQLTASSAVTLNSDTVKIKQDLEHSGDDNTKLSFPAADTITLTAGGVALANLTTDGFAFPQGISLDSSGITFADGTFQSTAAPTTITDSYTGQIETVANKIYTLDPDVSTARTITGYFIKSGSGGVTASLQNAGDQVAQTSVSTTSGTFIGFFSNTSVAAGATLSIVTTANNSATDVVFNVEYTTTL